MTYNVFGGTLNLTRSLANISYLGRVIGKRNSLIASDKHFKSSGSFKDKCSPLGTEPRHDHPSHY